MPLLASRTVMGRHGYLFAILGMPTRLVWVRLPDGQVRREPQGRPEWTSTDTIAQQPG